MRWCGGCEREREDADFAKGNTQCRECGRIRSRRWRQQNREYVAVKRRERHLRRAYGLTVEEFDGMVVAQQGRCAICGDPMTEPLVDHSHATGGAVRELLCHPCNIGLGFLERPGFLEAGVAYLKRHHPERY